MTMNKKCRYCTVHNRIIEFLSVWNCVMRMVFLINKIIVSQPLCCDQNFDHLTILSGLQNNFLNLLAVISYYFDRCIEICTSLNVIIGIDTAAMSPESSCYKKMTQNIDYLDCQPVSEKLLYQPNKIVFLPKVSYIVSKISSV